MKTPLFNIRQRRHSNLPKVTLGVAVLITSFTMMATTEPATAQPIASVTSATSAGEAETPELRQRFTGKLVTTVPVGGIAIIDLPTLTQTMLRPSNAGRVAVDSLSEPDEAGGVVFITEVKHAPSQNGYALHRIDADGERTLFTGPGDPLWDHAVSQPSLAPRGGKVAFVTKPPERESERFLKLVSGPLRIWEPATGKVRDLDVKSTESRPTWFPDSRRLAYVASTASSATNGTTKGTTEGATEKTIVTPESVVHILDTDTGEDVSITSGHTPIVSSDGKTVLITRGRTFSLILIDVATRNERVIKRSHGLGTPIALIDSRFLIYKGKTTPGAAVGVTTNNSPLVGPKAMLAIKLVDLETDQFTTLVPLIDPRSAVTALAVSQR